MPVNIMIGSALELAYAYAEDSLTKSSTTTYLQFIRRQNFSHRGAELAATCYIFMLNLHEVKCMISGYHLIESTRGIV